MKIAFLALIENKNIPDENQKLLKKNFFIDQIIVTSTLSFIPRRWELNEEGIDIFSNELHNEKIPLPVSVTDDGIDICINDSHCSNALVPIEITEEGIDISVNFEHPKKQQFSILRKVEGNSNETFFKDVHWLKASFPIA